MPSRYNRGNETIVNVGLSQDVIPTQKNGNLLQAALAEADQFQTEQVATARTIERTLHLLGWMFMRHNVNQGAVWHRYAERKVLSANVSSGGAKSWRCFTDGYGRVSMTNEKQYFCTT
jgi:hypothetical protein